MDDLPEQLDELAKQQQHDRPFKVITAAAAEIRSLREREAELEAELGYHGIYPTPIRPRDTKGDSDGDDGA